MNYLVTHYKNLAEQLQARINHIQQCLYEMDAAAGDGVDPLRGRDYTPDNTRPVGGDPNDPGERWNWQDHQEEQRPQNLPTGIAAPWNIIPAPRPGSIYYWNGNPYRYGGTGNGWQNWNGHTWETYWGGPQVPQDRPKPSPNPSSPIVIPAGSAPTYRPPSTRPTR